MDLEYCKDAVKKIDDGRGDGESAHCSEDELYEAFIRHVAEVGSKELRKMATEILKTKDISFARWCA